MCLPVAIWKVYDVIRALLDKFLVVGDNDDHRASVGKLPHLLSNSDQMSLADTRGGLIEDVYLFVLGHC